MSENYVVVKLISGETVMAMFEGEDEKFIKIEYPVQIKTTLLPELGREHVTASPLCQFSESTSFVLEKTHVIYIKRLHNAFIKHYKTFIKSYDEALVPAQRQSAEEVKHQLEDIFGDEEDTLTIEEVNRRLDILEAITNSESSEEDKESLLTANFVVGNDTKH